MTLHSTALAFVAAVALAGTAAAASKNAAKASDENVTKARQRFVHGVELYKDGSLDAALVEFNQAYTLAVVAVVASRDAAATASSAKERAKPGSGNTCSQPEARKDPDPVVEPGMDLVYRPLKAAAPVTGTTAIDEKDPYAS
jgi:hypothetical protein